MERSHAHSLEEENELVQSTKKVKDSHHGITEDNLCPREEPVHVNKLSFRDKLVGEVLRAYSQSLAFSDHMEAESESDKETEDIREGFATISLSKETKQRIRALWTKALIMKDLGKTVRYNFLHAKILSLWKPSGRIDMVDLGKDFYLITFAVMDDLERVLMKGPWFIDEHFLSICRWEANFKPSDVVSSVAVWVRFNELPIEYYDGEVLQQIGKALGTVLRVDTHTTTEARGRYACLCVQVDVSKPLITMVRIGQRNQAIVYEGVNKLCYSCGLLGHRREACQYTIKLPQSSLKDSSVLNDKEKWNRDH